MVNEHANEDEGVSDQRAVFGSLGSILLPLVLSWAAFLALLPLNDNSFFTHLATGRIILDEGQVPSSDPYTYTANGEPWTVQSWLASVAYAASEQVGGILGLRLLALVVFVAAGTVLWMLTRPAKSVVLRMGVAALAMVIATSVWSERPYMVGFIGLSLVLVALDRPAFAWVLVPFMWVWVNAHGSYPLALALCLTVLFGEWLDQRGGPVSPDLHVELRVLAMVTFGVVLSVVSPLGMQALVFPLRSLTQSDSFAQIVEWRSPEFTSVHERAFLLLALIGVVSIVASGRRRHAVPVVVFLAAALIARRNIVMALPILVTVVARAAPRLGTLRSELVPALGRPLAVVTWTLVPLAAVAGLDDSGLGLGGYPTAALSFLGTEPVEGRVVTQDFTGNLLEALDGPSGEVFIDDRADMFPSEVLQEYQILNRGEPGWHEVLSSRDTSHVVWKREHPLASILAADPRWQVEFADSEWFVARRR